MNCQLHFFLHNYILSLVVLWSQTVEADYRKAAFTPAQHVARQQVAC